MKISKEWKIRKHKIKDILKHEHMKKEEIPIIILKISSNYFENDATLIIRLS